MTSSSSGKNSHLDGDNAKLQQRLQLLREEYVKLQARLTEVERENAMMAATSASASSSKSGKTFAAEILRKVAELFNNETYSDIKIRLEKEEVHAHKLVMSARNESWGSLADKTVLDWSDIPNEVSLELLRWIYTNQVNLQSKDDRFKLELMRRAKSFTLIDLMLSCERALMSEVDVKNCIRFYTTADEIGATELKNHCSQLISTHWSDFSSEDFEHMTAPLLYTMFKTKTKFPLHSAVRLKREDVVFLYLIEYNQELATKVNQTDDRGLLPLDIALSTKQVDLANTLLEHKANVNLTDAAGHTLLHLAVARNDEFSALYLCDHGAQVNVATPETGDTALHLAAKFGSMKNVAAKLISLKADPNAQNDLSWTPLHVSIEHGNEPVFDLLLDEGVDLDVKTFDGFPPLYYALKRQQSRNLDETGFAAKLVHRGASTNTVCSHDGNTLLHLFAADKDEDAAIFLVDAGVAVDQTNRDGESALHVAASRGLERLTRKLIEKGANTNLQTTSGRDGVFRQSALHLAVIEGHVSTIRGILGTSTTTNTKPNLNLKNSTGQTPFGLALANGMMDIAADLLRYGANVDVLDASGMTLLHSAILNKNSKMAIFLLDNGADVNLRTDQGETCLELSIVNALSDVVDCLCRHGADMSAASVDSNPPLWIALESNHEDLASILVRNGADVDGWSEGPEGCSQTLLHRAIDENKDSVAMFLIRSGCDLNSPRKPGRDGRGGDEAHDLASPLHLCCQWGLEDVVRTLLEHGASINAKDVEGKTPLHHAIENGHQGIISLLLEQRGLDLTIRDKAGLSPFATAMTFRNNVAAKRILQIEPLAAEQYDTRGRNFLHTAILRDDLESVLFLLSIHVNVHSRTQDANSQLTPLLLAVQKGNEMIVRNLILAGASVNEKTTSGQTSLHLAAESNLSEVCSILLSNGVDFTEIDSRGNNALHLAVKEGHIAVVRVLLTESQIDAEAPNSKGRNPLHILANFGQENSVAIFDLFMESMPAYPINKPDAEGSTPLLLAYTKGNGALCRALVRSGAILGTLNHQGVSIFNCHVATKQLLYRLLDFLSHEPKWGEGDVCEECTTKFGITTRKHHCRHCGRLLCSKCSDKDMPILKYNLTKPVRVCDICADVLTVGPSIGGN